MSYRDAFGREVHVGGLVLYGNRYGGQHYGVIGPWGYVHYAPHGWDSRYGTGDGVKMPPWRSKLSLQDNNLYSLGLDWSQVVASEAGALPSLRAFSVMSQGLVSLTPELFRKLVRVWCKALVHEHAYKLFRPNQFDQFERYTGPGYALKLGTFCQSTQMMWGGLTSRFTTLAANLSFLTASAAQYGLNLWYQRHGAGECYWAGTVWISVRRPYYSVALAPRLADVAANVWC